MTIDFFNEKYPKMGQGPAIKISEDNKIIDEVAKAKDDVGFTHPNLHRRVYTSPEEILNHKYELGIQGVYSYRTTELLTHDEESTISETP